MEERVMMVKMEGEEGEGERGKESESACTTLPSSSCPQFHLSTDQMLSHIPHLQVPDPEIGYNFYPSG